MYNSMTHFTKTWRVLTLKGPSLQSHRPKLTELYLMGNKLKVFPEITNLPRFYGIDIGDSEHISVILDLLSGLTEIYCYSCPLSCDPDLCWFVVEDHNTNTYYYPLSPVQLLRNLRTAIICDAMRVCIVDHFCWVHNTWNVVVKCEYI